MKSPLAIFIVSTLVLTLLFFTLPINLFDGVIEVEEPHRSYTIETPLSLSYFIGIGYDDVDMANVKNFYLTTKGIAMAIIFIVGLPALLSYRVFLSREKKK